MTNRKCVENDERIKVRQEKKLHRLVANASCIELRYICRCRDRCFVVDLWVVLVVITLFVFIL